MWERKREGGREREREGERERESERERDVPSLSVGPDLAPTFKHPFMLAPRLSAIETTCFICWSLCEQPERSCDAARHTHTHLWPGSWLFHTGSDWFKLTKASAMRSRAPHPVKNPPFCWRSWSITRLRQGLEYRRWVREEDGPQQWVDLRLRRKKVHERDQRHVCINVQITVCL